MQNCIFQAIRKKTKLTRQTGEEEIDEFRVMRTWSVFNAEQVEGVESFKCQTILRPPSSLTSHLLTN